MPDWFKQLVAEISEPSEAAKRVMGDIERSDRRRREALKSLDCAAEFERWMKMINEPSEAAKRVMEDIARSVRQTEEAFRMFDPSWLKSLSEPSDAEKWLRKDIERSLSGPLKLYVPPVPTCRLALADQFEDVGPPCSGRRVGFEPWE